MVANQLAISWRSVGERSAIDWRSVGDCILGVCFWLQKVCNFFYIGRQPISDWSAIGRQLKTVSGLSTNAAAISCQPVGNHQKPFREVLLAATKTSLRPNRPCNFLQPVGDLLATTLQTPYDHPKFWSQGGRWLVASYVWPVMLGIGLKNKIDSRFTLSIN